MTSTKRISQASGSGEALDKRPSSGSPESAPGARSFSGPLCASCPASLAPGDGHLVCFRCLGSDHTAAAMAAPVSCVACRELPEEGILSRHLFFSPSVNLAEAIDLFRAGAPDLDDDGGIIDVDNLGFCQAGLKLLLVFQVAKKHPQRWVAHLNSIVQSAMDMDKWNNEAMHVPEHRKHLIVGAWAGLKCSIHVNGPTASQLPQVVLSGKDCDTPILIFVQQECITAPCLCPWTFYSYVPNGPGPPRTLVVPAPLPPSQDPVLPGPWWSRPLYLLVQAGSGSQYQAPHCGPCGSQ
ncbi:unnamed protein product [Boreogadus saida]